MNQRHAATNINSCNEESQRGAKLCIFNCNFVTCSCPLFVKCLDREGKMCVLGIVISLVFIYLL